MGLESVDLLSGLSAQELDAFEKHCRWHQYSANSLIFEQSGEIGDVYFVIEGLVRLVNYTSSGREITFSSVRQGGYFGEVPALSGTPRDVTAISAEKAQLASVTAETFRRLVRDHADIGAKVMSHLAATIAGTDDRIIDLCTLPAPQRIFSELLRMSEEDDVAPGTYVVRPMRTHAEIASRVNTTRETVTRALGHLVSNGIVERVSKSLYIRDRDELIRLARTIDSDADGG